MAFRIGQKITLKDDLPWENAQPGEIYPQFGVVYTVHATEWNEKGQFIWLQEIVNEPAEYNDTTGEMNFYSNEFRPIVEQKTDISIFTKILSRKKVRIRAPKAKHTAPLKAD